MASKRQGQKRRARVERERGYIVARQKRDPIQTDEGRTAQRERERANEQAQQKAARERAQQTSSAGAKRARNYGGNARR